MTFSKLYWTYKVEKILILILIATYGILSSYVLYWYNFYILSQHCSIVIKIKRTSTSKFPSMHQMSSHYHSDLFSRTLKRHSLLSFFLCPFFVFVICSHLFSFFFEKLSLKFYHPSKKVFCFSSWSNPFVFALLVMLNFTKTKQKKQYKMRKKKLKKKSFFSGLFFSLSYFIFACTYRKSAYDVCFIQVYFSLQWTRIKKILFLFCFVLHRPALFSYTIFPSFLVFLLIQIRTLYLFLKAI